MSPNKRINTDAHSARSDAPKEPTMSRQRSLQNSIPQWIAIALAISCLLAATPSHAGHKGLTIAIDWSPTKPEKESVWLGYLMARADYISEHSDAYPQQVGPVIQSFKEEVEARTTVAKIYHQLQTADKDVNLPYFNDLLRVEQAGFMREYVWHYLHQQAWKQIPASIRMEEFKSWQRSSLAGHKPMTRGGIRFEKAKK